MTKNKQLNTPILFLIFNRPEITEKVFAVIKKVRPSKLFIAADGPRKKRLGEIEKCKETRKITEKIDWPCEVKRLYQKTNLGCGAGPYRAIGWFFESVEEGIILEDDCLPNPSFFVFCEKMLNKYCDDKKVMHISGNNFLPVGMQNRYKYYFSKYNLAWGWATWKRAWNKYNFKMPDWPDTKKTKNYLGNFSNINEQLYWNVIFQSVYQGRTDVWDYQWLFAIWANEGKSIIPGINLVKNIGINNKGTHVNTNSRLIVDNSQEITKDPSPCTKSFSNNADNYISKNFYRISVLMVIAQFFYLKFVKERL